MNPGPKPAGFVGLFLAICLALPDPALALRPQAGLEGALESDLRSQLQSQASGGLEEESDLDLFKAGLTRSGNKYALTAPEWISGLVRQIASWVKNWAPSISVSFVGPKGQLSESFSKEELSPGGVPNPAWEKRVARALEQAGVDPKNSSSRWQLEWKIERRRKVAILKFVLSFSPAAFAGLEGVRALTIGSEAAQRVYRTWLGRVQTIDHVRTVLWDTEGRAAGLPSMKELVEAVGRTEGSIRGPLNHARWVMLEGHRGTTGRRSYLPLRPERKRAPLNGPLPMLGEWLKDYNRLVRPSEKLIRHTALELYLTYQAAVIALSDSGLMVRPEPRLEEILREGDVFQEDVESRVDALNRLFDFVGGIPRLPLYSWRSLAAEESTAVDITDDAPTLKLFQSAGMEAEASAIVLPGTRSHWEIQKFIRNELEAGRKVAIRYTDPQSGRPQVRYVNGAGKPGVIVKPLPGSLDLEYDKVLYPDIIHVIPIGAYRELVQRATAEDREPNLKVYFLARHSKIGMPDRDFIQVGTLFGMSIEESPIGIPRIVCYRTPEDIEAGRAHVELGYRNQEPLLKGRTFQIALSDVMKVEFSSVLDDAVNQAFVRKRPKTLPGPVWMTGLEAERYAFQPERGERISSKSRRMAPMAAQPGTVFLFAKTAADEDADAILAALDPIRVPLLWVSREFFLIRVEQDGFTVVGDDQISVELGREAKSPEIGRGWSWSVVPGVWEAHGQFRPELKIENGIHLKRTPDGFLTTFISADDNLEQTIVPVDRITAGMEEQAEDTFKRLESQVAQQRVLAVDAGLLRGGLEEFVARAQLGRVLVFGAVESDRLKVLAERNSRVTLVSSRKVTDVAAALLAMPEETVGVLSGLEGFAAELDQILPESMTVVPLQPARWLLETLSFFLPQEVLDSLDAAGLEADLDRLSAA